MKTKYKLPLLLIKISDEIEKLLHALSDKADKYIFNKVALPQVTLYQFNKEAQNAKDAKNIQESSTKEPVDSIFTKYRLNHSIKYISYFYCRTIWRY